MHGFFDRQPLLAKVIALERILLCLWKKIKDITGLLSSIKY